MIYREYGSSGVKISAIGFGGMRFLNQDDTDRCAALIKAAYEQGINYFDTAPGYGKSEDIFGAAFKEMSRSREEKPFYVSTKTMKTSPAEVRQDLETSLKRMGLDYVDFYHVWCVRFADEYRDRKAKGALKEFERMKDEGLIKNICLSTHMTGTDTAAVLADYPFAGVLLGYSVMNFPYRDAGLDAAAKLHRGVAVMNPLGGGSIPKHPEIFGFVKSRQDENVAEAALRFLINDQRITVVLVGLSSMEQIDEAIKAVDGFEPIPQEKVQQIRGNLSEHLNELCTACRYCEGCPHGIDVARLMQAHSSYMLSGNKEELMIWLRIGWAMDVEGDYLKRCTECGKCERACTQKLPIIERIRTLRNEVEEYLKAEKQNS